MASMAELKAAQAAKNGTQPVAATVATPAPRMPPAVPKAPLPQGAVAAVASSGGPGITLSVQDYDALMMELNMLRKKVAAYEKADGGVVHTHGVVQMAGHVPANTDDIPTTDQINGTVS